MSFRDLSLFDHQNEHLESGYECHPVDYMGGWGSGGGNRIVQTCVQLYAFDLESGRTRRLRRLTSKAVEPDV